MQMSLYFHIGFIVHTVVLETIHLLKHQNTNLLALLTALHVSAFVGHLQGLQPLFSIAMSSL
jgi:hypothetical protein